MVRDNGLTKDNMIELKKIKKTITDIIKGDTSSIKIVPVYLRLAGDSCYETADDLLIKLRKKDKKEKKKKKKKI